MSTTRLHLLRVVALIVTLVLAASACGGSSEVSDAGGDTGGETAPEPTAAPDASPDPGQGQDQGQDQSPPPSTDPDVEPVPFVPTTAVGSAEAYQALVDELAAALPSDVRSQVPWPDIRNPDPVQAQLDIFELWIWMAANHPEPALVDIMAAAGSPSHLDIATHFRMLDVARELRVRNANPYRAWDHRVVTFETAGLPLWLGRDVPADAVVVYYLDSSGPTTTVDRATGSTLRVDPAVPTRQWVSIMVPTDVGWQLWRDQLIEPGDAELQVPDALPAPDGPVREPDV